MGFYGILVPHYNIWSPNYGAPLLRGAPVIGRVQYANEDAAKRKKIIENLIRGRHILKQNIENYTIMFDLNQNKFRDFS